MFGKLEEIYTSNILTTTDLKNALENALELPSLELTIYGADPYIPGRWCLSLPDRDAIQDRDLVIDGDETLVVRGFRIVDFANYAIFEKQKSTRLAYKSNAEHDPQLLDLLVKTAFVHLSYNMMYLIRSRIIVQSYRSKDLDTFWHRAINDVILPIVKCEAGSVFIRDDRNHLLKLRGTSGLEALWRANRKKLQKRDVFYLPDEQSWVVQSLKRRQSIYEFNNFLPLPKGRYCERVNSEIWSRAYVPMLIRSHEAAGPLDPTSSDGTNEIEYPAGLLRLANPRFDTGSNSKRQFSWHDKFIIDFVVDVNTVLTRRYLELSKAHDDIEQVCHALGSEIATITRNAEFIRDNLFGSDEFSAIYDPSQIKLAATFKNLDIALSDIKLYVDDIHFQFEKVRKLAIDEDIQGKTTDRLFSDVLMKLVNSADALARIYGRKRVTINNLKESKLDELPKVVGTSAAWLSIFRNLFENSVKYASLGDDPDIKITWAEVDEKFVVIDFCDNGPGIPDEERDRIFLDGVRGRLAIESGQKGTGIGLAYCREVASKCGGRIELAKHAHGARFRVFMRRG
ncbi:sensor histidine kinase [Bradyrhizobium sp. cf659]|uniref:sensor histidine kinase n=1 Tax=Bradyrhizobium sp. cf659 TaxID=1761771 RepID=UPI0008EA71B2|nr:sensor histidine kinase [Bradyrhizobium sp. cf659]SFJ93776.1 Signal transduction histidine kinase [Bradyrhizobium sp. cf659]